MEQILTNAVNTLCVNSSYSPKSAVMSCFINLVDGPVFHEREQNQTPLPTHQSSHYISNAFGPLKYNEINIAMMLTNLSLIFLENSELFHCGVSCPTVFLCLKLWSKPNQSVFTKLLFKTESDDLGSLHKVILAVLHLRFIFYLGSEY